MDIEVSPHEGEYYNKRIQYSKEYYRRNKERLLAKAKEKRESLDELDKEYIKEYMKDYIKENKDKIYKKNIEYKKKNREKWNKYQREWARKRREKQNNNNDDTIDDNTSN